MLDCLLPPSPDFPDKRRHPLASLQFRFLGGLLIGKKIASKSAKAKPSTLAPQPPGAAAAARSATSSANAARRSGILATIYSRRITAGNEDTRNILGG